MADASCREISEEFQVTDDESSAGVPQNHEDYRTLPTGYKTKHYQLVYRGFDHGFDASTAVASSAPLSAKPTQAELAVPTPSLSAPSSTTPSTTPSTSGTAGTSIDALNRWNVSARAAAVATPRAGLTATIDAIPLSLSKSKRKRATDAGPSRAESIEQVEASELLPNEGIPEPAGPSNARPPRPPVGMFCAICLDAPCSMIVVPCGHKCLCEGCKESLEAQGRSSRSGKVHEAVSPPCPICRGSIQQIIKVIEAGSD